MVGRPQSRRSKPTKPTPRPAPKGRKPLAPSGRRGAPKGRKRTFTAAEKARRARFLRLLRAGKVPRGRKPRVRIKMTPEAKRHAKNDSQKAYRARVKEGESRPYFPINFRFVELAIRLAAKHDKLTEKEAEARSLNGRWVMAQLVDHLDKQCDDYDIPRPRHKWRK